MLPDDDDDKTEEEVVILELVFFCRENPVTVFAEVLQRVADKVKHWPWPSTYTCTYTSHSHSHMFPFLRGD